MDNALLNRALNLSAFGRITASKEREFQSTFVLGEKGVFIKFDGCVS